MAGLPGFAGDALPVVPGKLHGVRSFDVDVDEGTLHGVTFKETWNGSENVAECRDDKNKNRKHSMKDCDHGYWSYFGVNTRYMQNHRAHAVIEGYGEVIVGEEGFRAEKAKIKAVTVPSAKDVFSNRKDRARFAKFQKIMTLILGLLITSVGLPTLITGLFTEGANDLGSTASIILQVLLIGLSLGLLLVAAFVLLVSRDYNKEHKELRQEINKVENSNPNWALKQKELEAKMQEKYPDAVLYSNVKEMIHDHKDNIILHGMLLST